MLNDITRQWMELFILRPRAALIIESKGDTKSAQYIVNFLYSELCKELSGRLQNYRFEDKSSIGIQDVKDILKSLHLKSDKNTTISRFMVIENADRLTPEAQNILLKTIEELPENTIFILVAGHRDSLLSTVQSRCFIIPVLPINRKQAIEYAKKFNPKLKNIEATYAISEGKIGVFEKLLNEDSNKIIEDIDYVKKFLRSSRFERQALLTEVKDIEEFLRILRITAITGMRISKNTQDKTRWKSILKQTIYTQNLIEHNVNSKLSLLNLSVAIP